MATHTFQIEGTFSLAELKHVTDQVENLPFDSRTELERLGYDRYDYKAGHVLTAARRFRGKVTIAVEEMPHAPVPRYEPEADVPSDDAAK